MLDDSKIQWRWETFAATCFCFSSEQEDPMTTTARILLLLLMHLVFVRVFFSFVFFLHRLHILTYAFTLEQAMRCNRMRCHKIAISTKIDEKRHVFQSHAPIAITCSRLPNHVINWISNDYSCTFANRGKNICHAMLCYAMPCHTMPHQSCVRVVSKFPDFRIPISAGILCGFHITCDTSSQYVSITHSNQIVAARSHQAGKSKYETPTDLLTYTWILEAVLYSILESGTTLKAFFFAVWPPCFRSILFYVIPQSAFMENAHSAGNSKIIAASISVYASASVSASGYAPNWNTCERVSHILQLNLMHLQLHIFGCGGLGESEGKASVYQLNIVYKLFCNLLILMLQINFLEALEREMPVSYPPLLKYLMNISFLWRCLGLLLCTIYLQLASGLRSPVFGLRSPG